MGLKQPSLIVLKPPLGGLGVILVKNKDCEYIEIRRVDIAKFSLLENFTYTLNLIHIFHYTPHPPPKIRSHKTNQINIRRFSICK